jgi:cell division initiation protein
MKFSPMDLQLQRFGYKFRGYNTDEVKRFLEAISEDFQEIIKESNTLKEKLKKKDRDLLEHKDKEKRLQDTLVAAQKTSEDLKKNAEKKGEIIIAEARVTAEKILIDADLRLAQLLDQIKDIKREKIQFEASLKRVIEAHLKLLEAQASEAKDEIEERLKVFKEVR